MICINTKNDKYNNEMKYVVIQFSIASGTQHLLNWHYTIIKQTNLEIMQIQR